VCCLEMARAWKLPWWENILLTIPDPRVWHFPIQFRIIFPLAWADNVGAHFWRRGQKTIIWAGGIRGWELWPQIWLRSSHSPATQEWHVQKKWWTVEAAPCRSLQENITIAWVLPIEIHFLYHLLLNKLLQFLPAKPVCLGHCPSQYRYPTNTIPLLVIFRVPSDS
jgi:hypothetical protein